MGLATDFGTVMSVMDNDTTDLIRKLCARTGMLMEDQSMLAISAPSNRPGALAESVKALRAGCDEMRSLLASAEVLTRR